MFVAIRWVAKALVALIVYSTASFAPQALADTQARVPCPELDQINGILDNKVSAGIDGTRKAISSVYFWYRDQQRDADNSMQMVSDGVVEMQQIDIAHPIPGLAPQLVALMSATNDMRDSVDSLWHYWWGDRVPPAWPNQDTWNSIDNVDHEKDNVTALVNTFHGNCIH